MRLMFPPVSHVGSGALEHLGEEVAALGRRALLITGRGSLRRAGTLDRALGYLKTAGVSAEVFEGIPPEPDLTSVDAARDVLRHEHCDVVVALGGGSAMDVGKAAAALAAGDEPTSAYFAGRTLPARGVPIVAVPTTSGTGSEATPNSVLTDPAGPEKKSIRGNAFVPAVVIVDGDLTMSCPPDVTAHSGMDALTQAIESLISNKAGPTTQALSAKAVELIAGSLVPAFRNGSHREARMAMAEGSFLAGVALCNARLGAVHGLAHPIGALYHLPHGRVCATLLPVVLELNRGAVGARWAVLETWLGDDPIAAVRAMMETLGIADRFEFKPDERETDLIVAAALQSGSTKANPVPVDRAYLLEVLARVSG